MRFGFECKETKEEKKLSLSIVKLLFLNYPVVVIMFVPIKIRQIALTATLDCLGINVFGFFVTFEKMCIKFHKKEGV
jgi:hypothetical protein